MPILPREDPLWKGLPKSVDVLLPDIPEMAEDAASAPIFGVASGKYAARGAEIYQLASQTSLGSLLVNVGMPVKNVFDGVLGIMNIDVKAEIVAKLTEGGRNLQEAYAALQAGGEHGAELAEVSAEGVVGAQVNLVTAIPVAGWIVKILWNLVKAIVKIVQIVKESNREAAKARYPPTTFNPQLDNAVLNNLLMDLSAKKAWGRRWGPPSMGEGVGTLPDFGTRLLEPEGFEVYRRAGTGEDGKSIDWASAGWLGMVPGTPYLHQGIQVRQGWPSEIGNLLLPSARQILVWLWGNVLGHKAKVAPSMWCVDAKDLMLWRQYIYDLHCYVHEDLDVASHIKQRIIDHYNVNNGQPIFGWGSSVKPNENETDDYWPVKQANDLRDRQMGFLDTIMCAYVSPDYSAFDSDPGMKERLIERRKQLLEHPAICMVDISNVPDWEYQDALKAAGAESLTKCSGINSFAMRPPADMPDGSTYGKTTVPSVRRRRSSSAAVPFLALTAAAIAGWKAGVLKLPTLKMFK